jgi:hypothetical protein
VEKDNLTARAACRLMLIGHNRCASVNSIFHAGGWKTGKIYFARPKIASDGE